MKRRYFLVLASLALSLFFSAGVLALGDSYDLTWNNIGGGGQVSSSHFTLNSVIGQPDAAVWTSGSYSLLGGFLGQDPSDSNTIYLPMIKR